MLTLQEPARFPRSGHRSIAVFGLLHVLFAASSLEATGQLICSHCHWVRLCDTRPLRHDVTVSMLEMVSYFQHVSTTITHSETLPSTTFDDWLAGFWLNSFSMRNLNQVSSEARCPSCQQPQQYSVQTSFTATPPLFFVNVSDWNLRTDPHHTLKLMTSDGLRRSYHLCAAIYHGSDHWSSRWISPTGHVWGHDGQKHRGGLESQGKLFEPFGRSKYCSLRSFGSGTLAILIYALEI